MKLKLIILSILLLLLQGCAQEHLIFFPKVVEETHQYQFTRDYKEYNIPVDQGVTLNVLRFQVPKSKGVVLYLHGNSGNNIVLKDAINVYLNNQYDVVIFDYRGFGKSGGKIENEQTLYADDQKIYDFVKQSYPEKNIIILGYSIGSGLAAKLAADNHPKALILLAPYYSIPDLARARFGVPKAIVKYKLPTYQYLNAVNCPVYIFHGINDEIIPSNASLKLFPLITGGKQLFLLKNQDHNYIEKNLEFKNDIKKLLK